MWNEGFQCRWLKINLIALDTTPGGSKEIWVCIFAHRMEYLTLLGRKVSERVMTFSQIVTMDLFKSWDSVESPRNLYCKVSSKKVNVSYKNVRLVFWSHFRGGNWLRLKNVPHSQVVRAVLAFIADRKICPPGHKKYHSISLPGCLGTSANNNNFVFVISDVSCCFSEKLANRFSCFLNIPLKVIFGPCCLKEAGCVSRS